MNFSVMFEAGMKESKFLSQLGPENWYKKFQFCAGKRQSPIDILPAETTVEKRKLQNNYYNQPENLTFVLKNNGHSAQVDIGNATGLYSNAFGKVSTFTSLWLVPSLASFITPFES